MSAPQAGKPEFEKVVPVSSRLATVFLAVATIGIMSTLVCGLGWFLATRDREVALDDLGLEDRQRLVETFFDVSTKARTPAWFEPAVGFTLRRKAELTVWDDSFTSNDLGFRTGRSHKRKSVFRVVFVGDSWAYGMGLSEEESFPKQFEALANRLGGSRKTIEAWTLALPGYNILNELAALEVFFDRIQPDAVILCPTRNDNSSELFVLPDGSVRRPTGVYRDGFGDDHSLDYRYRFLDSHRYMARWRQAFGEIAKMETWLQERKVPFLLFFVAVWEEALIHDLVSGAGIQSPYLISPPEMATPDKQLPRWGHGTAETYRDYARLLYAGFSGSFGWKQGGLSKSGSQAGFFEQPPPGDWKARSRMAVSRWCARVPVKYQPTADVDQRQCAGPMDCVSGLMGRATTILLRRLPGKTKIEVTVRPVPNLDGLYPLDVSVSIPNSDGIPGVQMEVPAESMSTSTLEIQIPDSVRDWSVIEVEIRADTAVLAPNVLSLRSVHVESIRQK